ncbi:hypothetical protein Kalk_09485 [Ketobacter alkanivorans]|uniref:Uncharacterized protein n=1 Tax=Ketobacter alkanivorans TaxID=1917421 RepID=A0A2K9LKC8_9GAMM|nr:hypothetical protein Kalk_09485 [Ketobacter alkanivorans]
MYRLLSGNTVAGPVNNLITIQNGGGKGGDAGAAGAGGAGTEGKYINMRTLTGNRKWMAGGQAGQPGSAGKPGRDGVKGQALIQQDLRDRMDAMIQTQSAQVAALKDQLVTRLAEEKRQVEAAAAQAISALELQVTALKTNMEGTANQSSVDESITSMQQTLQQQSARIDELSAKLEQAMQVMDARMDTLADEVKGLNKRFDELPSTETSQ